MFHTSINQCGDLWLCVTHSPHTRTLHSEIEPKFTWLSVSSIDLCKSVDEMNWQFAANKQHHFSAHAGRALMPGVRKNEAESVLLFGRVTENLLLTSRPELIAYVRRGAAVTVTNQRVIRSKAKLPSINHEQKKLQSRNASLDFAACRSLLCG